MLAGTHLSSLSTTLLAPGSREPGSSRGNERIIREMQIYCTNSQEQRERTTTAISQSSKLRFEVQNKGVWADLKSHSY